MTKPKNKEPPVTDMPANMYKERVTHNLRVGEQYKVEQPKQAEPIDFDYSGLVQ